MNTYSELEAIILDNPDLVAINYPGGPGWNDSRRVECHMGLHIQFMRDGHSYVGTICGLGANFAILDNVIEVHGVA